MENDWYLPFAPLVESVFSSKSSVLLGMKTRNLKSELVVLWDANKRSVELQVYLFNSN